MTQQEYLEQFRAFWKKADRAMDVFHHGKTAKSREQGKVDYLQAIKDLEELAQQYYGGN